MNFIKEIIKPKQIINFAAGPTQLSNSVKSKAAKALINYNNTGRSICEITHFEDEWKNIYKKTIDITKQFLKIPNTHRCFYTNGGGNHQFASLYYNFCDKNSLVQVLISGYWSNKACEELEKFCKVQKIYREDDLIDSPAYNFTYYCENETIAGFEHRHGLGFKPTNHLLVCDTCSILGSKNMDIQNSDVIFSSLSKNLGIAGSSLVILNKDVINSSEFKNVSNIPTSMDWKLALNNNGPTPNIFAIYFTYLNIKEMMKKGGLNFYESYNIQKSELLYNYIDNSENFYSNKIPIKNRSLTNVVFSVNDSEVSAQNFIDFCEQKKMLGIKGHRFNKTESCRVSLYNMISLENVKYLIESMEQFKKTRLWKRTQTIKF